jgi:phage FluMu protein Com
MPIRFRCPRCTRLLGIARRKAGTRINCPQCAAAVVVPVQTENDPDLNELDQLLNPNPAANGNGAAYPAPQALDLTDLPDPEPGRPAVATAPRPVPARPTPSAPVPPAAPGRSKSRRAGEESPLFEQNNVDVLLGLTGPAGALDLDDETDAPRKAKPVSGTDATSLDDGPGKIVLSPQKATLLVIAVVVLLGVAFAAGFLIASNL